MGAVPRPVASVLSHSVRAVPRSVAKTARFVLTAHEGPGFFVAEYAIAVGVGFGVLL